MRVIMVKGPLTCPPNMYRIVAALLNNWSMQTPMKSMNINSATARSPVDDAPMAVPMKAASERGVQHPFLAELLDQADGGAERTAPGILDALVLASGASGDLLAHDDDVLVQFHLLTETFVDGFPKLDLPGACCLHRGGHLYLLKRFGITPV